MRLYSITNMYMQAIHAGIQTQHSTVELYNKYDYTDMKIIINGSTKPLQTVKEWAKFHKTTVVLNGGMHLDLVQLEEELNAWETNTIGYDAPPYAYFLEPGINNAMTSISVVFDQTAIDFMSEIRALKPREVTSEAYDDLLKRIELQYNKCAIVVLEKIAFMPLAK